MGGYNRTFSVALPQPKFYLLRQPLGARVSELLLPESTMTESTRGDPPNIPASHWSQRSTRLKNYSSITALLFGRGRRWILKRSAAEKVRLYAPLLNFHNSSLSLANFCLFLQGFRAHLWSSFCFLSHPLFTYDVIPGAVWVI